MPLPVPNLDDRRFDDLVAEAKARLAAHLPELTQVSPGDPIHTVIDLFAWLTETLLYRANLIPERQRRIFLNLLQIPLRPALPGQGVVCIDASPSSAQLPPLVEAGTQLRAGKQPLTVLGEVQPTPLTLQVLIKQALSTDELRALGMTLNDLHEQYGLRRGETPQPYLPKRLVVGRDTIDLSQALDTSVYLAAIAPKQLDDHIAALRDNVAGIRINIALAPADDLIAADTVVADAVADSVNPQDALPRILVWELVSQLPNQDGSLGVRHFPLEVISDTSMGGRQVGVVRLRLPNNSGLFADFANADPMFDGTKAFPPALDDAVRAQRVVFWLRLRCPQEPTLQLSYLGINGIDVAAQGQRVDRMLGVGTGQPDQVMALPDGNVDPATLVLEVEDHGSWVPWRAVDVLANQGEHAQVYQLNRETGLVYFGDGQHSGKRPPVGAGIRIATYRYGGGAHTNLAVGTIKELVEGHSRHKLRHDLPLQGGRDGETVQQAEQRIPTFLTHRNRAVTVDDFIFITLNNPVNTVARTEVIPGFLPGITLDSARFEVPGTVSVFVLPPAERAMGNTPKPTKGLLKDVFDYLSVRTLVGTELYVLSPLYQPIAVSVMVQVKDPQTEQMTLNAVQHALVEYLWLLAPGGREGQGWPMGHSVRPQELLTQVAKVDGVLSVNGLALFSKETLSITDLSTKDALTKSKSKSKSASKPPAKSLTTARGVPVKTVWRTVSNPQGLALAPYELPDLQGVRVAIGNVGDALKLPAELNDVDEAGSAIAVPVIPEVC
ncbi:baseplate J/gp47 family protein [Marinibactrum halimedae]|uniref:Baseplate assembly protein n=1 Tax=Marinibactrum halimedae TaxID=1444977 RepID=A0AA37T6T2_9GAMM|nr:baseplate J/gp47 family protein [Marinibactrum halimedae]MCD9460623.1 baseplate J/gp47 family protein [Marinibactrum halimedae]GLS27839.1 hypothetical protein GCM10007877_35580 [Marinibactrum halimedae]